MVPDRTSVLWTRDVAYISVSKYVTSLVVYCSKARRHEDEDMCWYRIFKLEVPEVLD